MEKFRIRGGNAIKGRVSISGAKNSALPCMAAAILTPGTITLHNIPYVRDIITQRRLLEDIGRMCCAAELPTPDLTAHIEVMAALRVGEDNAGISAGAGSLTCAFGKARAAPGGCAHRPRPVDLHLAGFTKLGAEVFLEAGHDGARAKNRISQLGGSIREDLGHWDGKI